MAPSSFMRFPNTQKFSRPPQCDWSCVVVVQKIWIPHFARKAGAAPQRLADLPVYSQTYIIPEPDSRKSTEQA